MLLLNLFAIFFFCEFGFIFAVYGNDDAISKSLRTFENGQMKNNKNKVLPETCDDPTTDCYLTGIMCIPVE